MYISKPMVLHDAIEAIGVGVTLKDNMTHRDPLTLDHEKVILQFDFDVSAFTCQPQQSLDGINWHDVGSPITEATATSPHIVTLTGVVLPMFRVNVSAITGTAGQTLTITAY